MRIVRNTGLLIVGIAFAIFIASLFLNSYTFSSKSMEAAGMTEEQQEYFDREIKPIEGIPYSKFNFILEVKAALKTTNTHIIKTFSVDEKTIELIIDKVTKNGDFTYSTSLVSQIFDGKDIGSAYQLKGITDYTSWMNGKKYADRSALKKELEQTLSNFNNSIVYQKGFDDYTIKSKLLNIVLASGSGKVSNQKHLFFFLTFILAIFGAFLYITPKFFEGEAGIKNNGIFKDPLNNKGWSGILLGSFLIIFYLLLYFYPVYIAEWISISDVASHVLFNREASQWFLYGLLYTMAVLIMGFRFLTKYRHNKYQQYRTYSVMFFQLGFAFVLPQILYALNLPEVDLKNIWPLDYSFFYDWRFDSYMQSGAMGMSMMIWGIGLTVTGVPVFTYFYGKRWYCSWVCGCGGLAETAGDSFRQLSSKKLSSWKIERYMIHSVLVFAVMMTIWVFYTTLTSKSNLLGISSYEVRKVYGFMISSVFAGVVGTGFYPLMGNRVWCRFGCPLAAYLGIVQKFKSRFRITTNGGQCISCGNCSTYCEMGIDVRAYAQRGQNIIRSSCVGCGVCAAVCPRGVLKLENTDEQGRYNEAVLLGNDGVINIRAERIKTK